MMVEALVGVEVVVKEDLMHIKITLLSKEVIVTHMFNTIFAKRMGILKSFVGKK